jgi:hypothetical protein
LAVDSSMGGDGRPRHVLTVARQGTRWRHCKGGWLIRERRPGRSRVPNMMGKEAKWRGDHEGAHLGQQTTRRAAVAAHGGGVAPQGSGDDGSSLRWTSGSKKMMGSFAAVSSSSSQPSIEVTSSGRWRAMAAARDLGLSSLLEKIRSI